MSAASTDNDDSDEDDLAGVDADPEDLVSEEEFIKSGGQSDKSVMGMKRRGVLGQVMHEEQELHDKAKRARVKATGRNPYLLAFRA